MTKRKICVVTGSRAEYGLLYWLMKDIAGDPDLSLQVIATGMHLSPEFGLTYRILEKDGFNIDRKVEMLLSSDSPVGVTKSIGLGVIGFAEALSELQPDILVLLGDRFEILAAAQAAMVARIPIAHLHGGEATEGVIDEAIRHAVTKMAHFHFVAAEPYRRRVIQMGEEPDRVLNVGAMGLDNIRRLSLLSRDELGQALDFHLHSPLFLVTYHPVTLRQGGTGRATESLLSALDRFPDAQVIFTKANSDTEGRVINQMLDDYAQRNPRRARVFVTLGQLRYLSLMKLADAVIGNSSSGLIEAPAMNTPTVNIGERQRGRLKASSVIDCGEGADEIEVAVRKALSSDFRASAVCGDSPYGSGGAAGKVARHLKQASLQNVIMKTFHDLDAPVAALKETR